LKEPFNIDKKLEPLEYRWKIS